MKNKSYINNSDKVYITSVLGFYKVIEYNQEVDIMTLYLRRSMQHDIVNCMKRGDIMLDDEVFEKAGIDYENGLERCLGDESLYTRLLGMFKEDNAFERLTTALDIGDVTDAFECAHALKGVAANLGMNALFETDSKLTNALRGDGNLDKARELYPSVKEAYNKVMEALKSI